MTEKDDNVAFIKAKDLAYGNLESIRLALIDCVDEGMMDLEDALYNQLLGLLADVSILHSWNEMEELVSRAKILEDDIAAWLSMHGRSSVSYSWPQKTI